MNREKKWIIGKDGVRIIEYVEKHYEEIDKEIKKDVLLSRLQRFTKSI